MLQGLKEKKFECVSLLLLHTDSAVASLSLAMLGILALQKFDWSIDWFPPQRCKILWEKMVNISVKYPELLECPPTFNMLQVFV